MAQIKPHTVADDGRILWNLGDGFGVVWNPLFREVALGDKERTMAFNTEELDLLIDTLLAVRGEAERGR